MLTVFYTSIYRGVVAAGPDRRIDAPPPLPEPAGEDRAPLWEAAVPVAPELPHPYTECADIWNPIHTERAAALAAADCLDIILHGTATLALAAREALDREAAGEPERLARLARRFGAMNPSTRPSPSAPRRRRGRGWPSRLLHGRHRRRRSGDP
ncbi:MAG: hypothetical protein U0531_20290 [Dehalococcoidia bacterium]